MILAVTGVDGSYIVTDWVIVQLVSSVIVQMYVPAITPETVAVVCAGIVFQL